jgi:predicted dehydrogenase
VTVTAAPAALRVLVVGIGNMGRAHAEAYARIDGFAVVGLCARSIHTRREVTARFPGAALFTDFTEALVALRPDVVSINSYPATHAAFAIAALEAGAHVFVEKPIARTLAEADAVIETARRVGRQVLVGHILRVHPAWRAFIDAARTLGKPLVMRMNLNQQGDGEAWNGMRRLMQSLPPLLDCGVHYVDMMCLATGARPRRVQAIGARLSDDAAPGVYNYGQLQIGFDDGSVGWYEAGWGPMISSAAYAVKDIVGPRGAVTMVGDEAADPADVEGHTRVRGLRLHHAELGADGRFARADTYLPLPESPGHEALCELEQRLLLAGIRGEADLTNHLEGARDSLRVVLAADESIRTGNAIVLES